MSFSSNPIVSEITGYTEQHKSDLILKSLVAGKSREMFNFMQVNGDTTINLAVNDVQIQPLDCGFTHSGSTTYSQRVLKPVGIKVNMEWCDKVLIPTYQNHLLKIAAGRETLPYSEVLVNDVLDQISVAIEKMVYQGTSGQTNQFEGLISILDNDATSIKVNVASGTSAYEAVRQVAAALPKDIKNPKILVGADTYFAYIQALVDANLYHYMPNEYEAGADTNTYVLPGTDIQVVMVPGLTGTGKIIAANMDNIFYGCNLSVGEDDGVMEFWFSQDDRTFKFCWEGLMGVNVAFPDLCVIATLN